MAGATQIRRVEYKVKRGAVMRKSQTAQRKATQELAKQMDARLKKVLSKQTGKRGPAAPPGQSPRRRTGFLQSNTTVKQEGRTLVVRTPNYGIWLEGGTSRMEARPFLRKNIHDKRQMWDRKWKSLMKRFMK